MQSRHIGYIFLWTAGALISARYDPAAFQLYTILSIFLLIFRNLGQRMSGPSAYSVFNPNCEPILGQLNAAQFDNEIRHRPVYVLPQHPWYFTCNNENTLLTVKKHSHSDQQQASRQSSSTETPQSAESILDSVRREIQQENRRIRRAPPTNFTRRRR